MQDMGFRKRFNIAIFFLLFLVSCAQKSPWQLSHMQTGTKEFNSSRLSYHSKDKVNGIDVEFIQTEKHLYGYLQVHAHPINNPTITLITPSQEKCYPLLCHAGGHRIFLSEELQNDLISLLLSHQPITLQLDGYQTVLDPTHFQSSFEKLQKPLSFLNLFSL